MSDNSNEMHELQGCSVRIDNNGVVEFFDSNKRMTIWLNSSQGEKLRTALNATSSDLARKCEKLIERWKTDISSDPYEDDYGKGITEASRNCVNELKAALGGQKDEQGI